MKKIPTLFERNHAGDRRVRDEIVPGAEWVAAGEGIATRNWDGAAVLVKDGVFYKRYDAKAGRTPPQGFMPAQPEPDKESGHWPGWVTVGEGPDDRWIREAVGQQFFDDGTYELVGPKVQGNPEETEQHMLIRHGATILEDAPRTFHGLKTYLSIAGIEGIVWHHADGRMVKIKAKDFGLKRERGTIDG